MSTTSRTQPFEEKFRQKSEGLYARINENMFIISFSASFSRKHICHNLVMKKWWSLSTRLQSLALDEN